jgi:hypothetical protein
LIVLGGLSLEMAHGVEMREERGERRGESGVRRGRHGGE